MNNLSIKTLILILLISVLATNNLQAQITIGSKSAPSQGSLLDLKEGEDGASTKGLGLPRVSLAKLDGDLAETMGANSGNYGKDEHIGMIVYNVNRCANTTNDAEGIHVWDGTEWEPLNPPRYSEVKGISGRVYRTATFGDAGEWMIDNLAETAYELPETEALVKSHNPQKIMELKAYYYPTNVASYTGNPVTDSQFYDKHKESNIGLLYTWAAATNGVYDSEYDTAGKPNKPTKIVQGICPEGWYVPSDYDWGLLEKELATNPMPYSSVIIPTAFDESDSGYWKHSTTSSWYGKHGTAMRSECSVPGSAVVSTGKSSIYGFNISHAGFIFYGVPKHYGEHSFFWASTSIRSPTKAWYRGYQNDKESSGRGSSYDRANLHSVRCKKR